jgi:DNA/RNA-binding domain of Phe-tRNA-synthetase-like protein
MVVEVAVHEDWRISHPAAFIGLLELSNVENHSAAPALETRKREIEARLRERFGAFTRQDFFSLPVMEAYRRYYKRFEKTFHVLLQLESIAQKGKNLPNVSPLVDANFMAEVETFVLTAGHDADRLEGKVFIDISRQGESITQMNGTVTGMRPGDMLMRDQGGVCCTIIYGQDNRSPISAQTTHSLYVAYAPEGVSAEMVETHLGRIEEYVRLFCPDAVVVQRRLLSAYS